MSALHRIEIAQCNGGLNLRDAETTLKDNESPELVNVWWENGVLRSRPGQEWVSAPLPQPSGESPETDESSENDSTGESPETDESPENETMDESGENNPTDESSENGSTGESPENAESSENTEDSDFPTEPVTYAVTPQPFHNTIYLHAGTSLWCFHPADNISSSDENASSDGNTLPVPERLCDGVPRAKGTFFRFADCLYYKNPGGFFRISPDHSVTPVDAENAYIPTVLVNANPLTGRGTDYESPNRLGIQKRICYTAVAETQTAAFSGDGLKRAFALGITDALGVQNVYFDNNKVAKALYSFDPQSGVVIFLTAPADGITITFEVNTGNCVYHLPESNVDSVDEVRVNGATLTPVQDYTTDFISGTVTFRESPPVDSPVTENTVEIVYSRTGSHAQQCQMVMDCACAAVCTDGNVPATCIVFGGGAEHPDTLLWSDRPDYWPLSHVHSISDYSDAVTAFGKLSGHLIVFRTGSINTVSFSMERTAGWSHPVLNCRAVHEKNGGLPGSVQTCGNHLVFCSPDGVYLLRSVSGTAENRLECVSAKINGSIERPGLLHDLRISKTLSSCDDGKHYFLAVNEHIWVWDYSSSTVSNPVWYFFTDMHPAAWFTHNGNIYHLNTAGRITKLGRTLSDYGEPVRKVYQFPVRHFGGYDRLKDVTTVIVSVPADAPCNTSLIYESDYETRTDPMPLQFSGYNRLEERDLTVRNLSVPRHAMVFRRRPVCRHIRHFAMRMENRTVNCDMGILSVEMQYRFPRRDR